MSFLGELFAQFLGDLAAGALSRNRQPRRPFPEGEAQASLGAVASFFGTLSLVFGGEALLGAFYRSTFDDMGAITVSTMAALALAGAYGALRAGRKAPLVTRRHLGLAKYGVVISVPAMFVSAFALVLSIVRVLQWRQ